MIEEERAYAPHCDSSVLHAPGVCHYCDLYPDWQEHRKVARIAYTGAPKEDHYGLLNPDPATYRRSLVAVNRWVGNRPSTEE